MAGSENGSRDDGLIPSVSDRDMLRNGFVKDFIGMKNPPKPLVSRGGADSRMRGAGGLTNRPNEFGKGLGLRGLES